MVRNFTRPCLIFLLALIANTVYAGNPVSIKNYINPKDWSFVENKGQLADQQGNIITDVKFYSHSGSAQIYCSPSKISFVFTKIDKVQNDISEATGGSTMSPAGGGWGWKRNIETEREEKITTSRIDLTLINSNLSAIIIPSAQQEYYENFYLAHTPEQGITNVHTFKTITYQNIYPNIDMVWEAAPASAKATVGNVKYSFIVHPGGKVSDIRMQWNGLNAMKQLENGGISYAFGLGKMEEGRPVSFQDSKKIKSGFIKKGNRVGFKVGTFDRKKDLVIDPELVWATYFGGSELDVSRSIAIDDFNNEVITGYTWTYSGLASPGAYQQTNASGGGLNCYDAFVSKFSPSVGRLWTTYFGGTGAEVGISISLDVSENIVITGYTTSNAGISTSGAFQTNYSGRTTLNYGDAYIAKFSRAGMRIWGTYFGGGGDDIGNSIKTDPFGNIFITGTTNSTVGISSSGAWQVSNGGRRYNIFIAKFSPSGNRIWSTYFGKKGDEIGEGIAIDISGNVLITGAVNDSGLASIGAFQSNYGGVFIAKFSSSGNRIWSTYFGGGRGEEGRGIATDLYGNIIITGYSISDSSIATKGAYQTKLNNGSEDAFVAKFSPSGARIWSTYFGGSGNDIGYGVCISRSGNIFITGTTTSISGIASLGAYQTSYGGGNSDAFIARFSATGIPDWVSYFGGSGQDESFGIATNQFGEVLITGLTSSTQRIAIPGAFQGNYGGGYFDAFVAKFNAPKFNFDAAITLIKSPLDSSCPGSQIISVQLNNFGKNELDSLKINWSINGKVQTPYQWIGKLQTDSSMLVNLGNFNFTKGNVTIKAWTTLPNRMVDSFPQNDSSVRLVYFGIPIAIAGPDTILCYNQTYSMQGSGGITYLWTPAKYLDNDTIAHPKATLPNTQLYTLYVHNKFGCEDSANVLLKVRPKLQVRIIGVQSPACYGDVIILAAKGSGGDSLHYAFKWPNDSVTGNILIQKMYKSGWHTVILTDNCTPLSATDSIFVEVTPKPVALFRVLNGKPYKTDTSVHFHNFSNNAASYYWTFGDNKSTDKKDPDHLYTDSGSYKITLVAYGGGGCGNDTAIQYIQIISGNIQIFIPNIFTPNEDSKNDYFEIKGTGIKDYTYSIYNRWGELIFIANSTAVKSPLGDLGVWDGTFKGVPVPEGVYIYLVTVTDIFDEKHYLSGNVTISR
jgi:gliding motility-associated-like protein